MSYIPAGYDLAQVKEKMHLRAGEGFVLLDPLEEEQKTSSGILIGTQTQGEAAGMVLSCGPIRGTRSEEDRRVAYIQPGTIVVHPRGQGLLIFDAGLDRSLLCLGHANILAWIDGNTWKGE